MFRTSEATEGGRSLTIDHQTETIGMKGWTKKAWKLPIIVYLADTIQQLPAHPKTAEDLGKIRAICHLLRTDQGYRQKAIYLLTPLRELSRRVPLLPKTATNPLDEHQLIAEELQRTINSFESFVSSHPKNVNNTVEVLSEPAQHCAHG